MSMKKTLLDLYVCASKAALQSIELADAHAVATFGLEYFNKAGNSPADFQSWHQTYVNQRSTFLQLRKQNAPSAAAPIAPVPPVAPAAAKPKA